MGSYDEWTRWSGRCGGALLDAHPLTTDILPLFHERLSRAAAGTKAVDQHRAIHPAGFGIHHGIHNNHPGATREVARALSDIEGQIQRLLGGRRELAAGRLRLTGKALDSLQTLWYPPWTIPKDV